MRKNKLSGKYYILFFALLILDQLTKFLVVRSDPNIDLKIFSIVFVKNTGAIWGLFQDSNLVFIWASLIAIGLLMNIYDKIPKRAFPFFILLFAGVIGNLIDRIFRTYVVDFIDFKFWPVFNFADSFIVIGVIFLIIYLWKEKDFN